MPCVLVLLEPSPGSSPSMPLIYKHHCVIYSLSPIFCRILTTFSEREVFCAILLDEKVLLRKTKIWDSRCKYHLALERAKKIKSYNFGCIHIYMTRYSTLKHISKHPTRVYCSRVGYNSSLGTRQGHLQSRRADKHLGMKQKYWVVISTWPHFV